jgi:hypothetical protein
MKVNKMTTVSRPPELRRRALSLAALVVASGVVGAGCGSSGSPAALGSGAKGGPAPASYQQAVRFSECMRTHGVPGFPDPTRSAGGGGGVVISIHAGSGAGAAAVDPSSPSFTTAREQCRKLMPGGGPGPGGALPPAAKQQALKYSACMRSHGVPSFPDPQFSGGGMRLTLPSASAVDPASPAFKSAQLACGSPFPGGVLRTQASVGGPG